MRETAELLFSKIPITMALLIQEKIFMEHIAFPLRWPLGFDGVFIGAPPNLLFVPDRNHDDGADKKILK